jgi:hypothetical protein
MKLLLKDDAPYDEARTPATESAVIPPFTIMNDIPQYRPIVYN